MKWLLGAQDSNSTLVEAVWVFLGGDVKVNGEDEVGPREVQVHGQSHLQQGGIKCIFNVSSNSTGKFLINHTFSRENISVNNLM